MRTTPPGALANTLFGRTRREVLSLLFGSPDKTFYVREVARATGGALGAVQKELAALTAAGILDRSVRGRQVYFGANQRSPVFAELRSLIAKTAGVPEVIRYSLEPIETDIDVAFVFGSIASGDERDASDIDLFVVGRVGFGDVVDAISGAQRTLGREINPVVQSPAEFARRVRSKDHFVSAVLQTPRMLVIGDDDELEAVAGKRLAAAAPDKPTGNRGPSRDRRQRPARQRRGRSER